MPEGPKDGADRRASDSSITSGSSPTERRRACLRLKSCVLEPIVANLTQSSTTQRFGALEALKRPQDTPNRRQSLQDAYGKVGVIGTMWNK